MGPLIWGNYQISIAIINVIVALIHLIMMINILSQLIAKHPRHPVRMQSYEQGEPMSRFRV